MTGKVPVLPHQILHQVHVIVDNKSVIFDGEALIVAMEARHVLGLGEKRWKKKKKVKNQNQKQKQTKLNLTLISPFHPYPTL